MQLLRALNPSREGGTTAPFDSLGKILAALIYPSPKHNTHSGPGICLLCIQCLINQHHIVTRVAVRTNTSSTDDGSSRLRLRTMEAIGAASSILAIIQLAGKVSAAANSFMRDVKDARQDMIQLKKDMSTLLAVLEVMAGDPEAMAEDLEDNAPSTGILQGLHRQISNIASSCRVVLLEIGEIIGPDRSRIGWVASGRAQVEKLRERLGFNMSLLDIALDMLSMVILLEIKGDTTRILSELVAFRHDTSGFIDRLDQIEQKLSEGNGSGPDTPSPVMLERYLDGLRNDAETVLSSIDYQQDTYANNLPQPRPETLVSTPLLPPVLFRDSRDPCQDERNNVAKMEKAGDKAPILPIITPAEDHPLPLQKACQDDVFDAVNKEGDGDNVPTLSRIATIRGHTLPLQRPRQDEASNTVKEEKHSDEAPISFRDAMNRDYSFPWHLARSWPWVEATIKEAFIHVKSDIVHHVQRGLYSLYGPGNDVIRSWKWEKDVEPGMSITMKMWSTRLMPQPCNPQPERERSSQAGPDDPPTPKSTRSLLPAGGHPTTPPPASPTIHEVSAGSGTHAITACVPPPLKVAVKKVTFDARPAIGNRSTEAPRREKRKKQVVVDRSRVKTTIIRRGFYVMST